MAGWGRDGGGTNIQLWRRRTCTVEGVTRLTPKISEGHRAELLTARGLAEASQQVGGAARPGPAEGPDCFVKPPTPGGYLLKGPCHHLEPFETKP